MISWLLSHIEYIALIVNVFTFICFVIEGKNPGKMVYWAGTILIVIGLLKMKG